MDKIIFAVSAFLLAVSVIMCALLYNQFEKFYTPSEAASTAQNAGKVQDLDIYTCAPAAGNGKLPAATNQNSISMEDIYKQSSPHNPGQVRTAKDYFADPAPQKQQKSLPAYAHFSNAAGFNSNSSPAQAAGGCNSYQGTTNTSHNSGRFASSDKALSPSAERKMLPNEPAASECSTCQQLASPNSPKTTENPTPGSTVCANKLQSKNDELFAMLNPPPAPERYLHINPIYNYGKAKTTPLPSTGLAARCSTEALVAEVISYTHFPEMNPIAARAQTPTWDEQLHSEKGVWRFYINPYWKRTDFGAAFDDAPSSKWDELGILLGGAWSKGIYDVAIQCPIEKNSFGGQMSSYDFTRLGVITSSNFRFLRQCAGKPLNFSVGTDLYLMGVLGSQKYIKNELQYGGGLYGNAGRDFGIFSTQATLQWQCNSGNDYDALPTHMNVFSFRLDGGVPLGKSVNLNPYFKYNTALSAPETLETKSWQEYGMDIKFALAPTTVFTFNIAAEDSPLKTWHLGGGLDIAIKF